MGVNILWLIDVPLISIAAPVGVGQRVTTDWEDTGKAHVNPTWDHYLSSKTVKWVSLHFWTVYHTKKEIWRHYFELSESGMNIFYYCLTLYNNLKGYHQLGFALCKLIIQGHEMEPFTLKYVYEQKIACVPHTHTTQTVPQPPSARSAAGHISAERKCQYFLLTFFATNTTSWVTFNPLHLSLFWSAWFSAEWTLSVVRLPADNGFDWKEQHIDMISNR